jgi:hypothetical protein
MPAEAVACGAGSGAEPCRRPSQSSCGQDVHVWAWRSPTHMPLTAALISAAISANRSGESLTAEMGRSLAALLNGRACSPPRDIEVVGKTPTGTVVRETPTGAEGVSVRETPTERCEKPRLVFVFLERASSRMATSLRSAAFLDPPRAEPPSPRSQAHVDVIFITDQDGA